MLMEYSSDKPSATTDVHLLEGHQDELFSCSFSSDGYFLASGGSDRQILIWEVFAAKPTNILSLKGHSNAVFDLKWSEDSTRLFSASVDKTVAVWDLLKGEKIKTLKGHEGMVNQLAVRAENEVVSVSDDGQVILWDTRSRKRAVTLPGEYPLTTVACSEDVLFVSGVDPSIQAIDLKTHKTLFTLRGHTDTVTSVALASDGERLLSNSTDNSIRIWDCRHYCRGSRLIKKLSGHSHNYEKNLLRVTMAKDGKTVASGSSDNLVYLWNIDSGKQLGTLDGHKGSVNEVSFNDQGLIASCSSDSNIILGKYN